ncbi:hypothetical protein BD560DRAFT_380970 [Blakeslea trispora]|nr:hypothetical protein BD560DRAFT_380970 [Blakeslea trispora]
MVSSMHLQQIKTRKRSLTRCVECQLSFRPHLWGRESGKGPVCDQCSNTTLRKEDELLLDNKENMICSNCQATNTPLWRRDAKGNTICNACGLYYKLHHVHRPATMMRTEIKRRKRCTSLEKKQKSRKPSMDSDHSDSQSEEKLKLPPIQSYYPSCTHTSSMESLYSRRLELQKEVSRLSKLLSSTVAKLSDIDQAIIAQHPEEQASLKNEPRLPPISLAFPF